MAEELLSAARGALARGDAVQAAELAEQAARAGAGPRAWRLQAAAFIAMGRPAMAERALRRALEANPNDPDTLLELAELLASRGRVAKARELLQHAAAAAPDRPAIQQALARLSSQHQPSRILPALAVLAALMFAAAAVTAWVFILRPHLAARLSAAQPSSPAQQPCQPLPQAASPQSARQAPAHAAAPAAERQQAVAQRPAPPPQPQQALPSRPPAQPSQAALTALQPQTAQQSPLPAAHQAPPQPQQPLPSVQPQPQPAQQPFVATTPRQTPQQPLAQATPRQAPQRPLASGPPQPVPHQTPPQPMPQPEQIRVRILWVRCQFEKEEEGLQEDQVVRRFRMWGELLNESNRPLRVILVRGRLLVNNQTVGYGLGEVANVPPGARAGFEFPCFQVTSAGSPMPNGYDAMALPGVDWRQVVRGMGLGALEPLIEQAITRSGGM